MSILEETPPRRDDWIGTRWSLVARLDQRGTPAWESSWRDLVAAYQPAMERYVQRVLVRDAGRAEASDIVQEFLAACAEKDWLSRADPARGRFRAYLQVLLRRYTYRVLKRAHAQRRAPGEGQEQHALLDGEALAPVTPAEQAELDEFSRTWVEIAVERTLASLAQENERYRVVIQDLIATGGEGSADLGQRVGLRRQQVAVLRHRARARFGRLFVEELAATVGDQDAFDEEWRAIRRFLPPGL